MATVNPQQKIILIVGPTASGKSALAVDIARRITGEVISADSRQVYTGLDIGTGKITRREMRGVPHHLLDVASPKKRFTVERFVRLARAQIEDIARRKKIPIICGGTGFYISALLGEENIPNVPANEALRTRLARLNADHLMRELKRFDPRRAKNIDPHNTRRIIRAIEIARALGRVPAIQKNKPQYTTLSIGLMPERTDLRERITKRLRARMKHGMLAEARRLHNKGLSWKRMDELGLEYRFLAQHLQGTISKEEMLTKLDTEIWHYARRQMTWFKRDTRIKWFSPEQMTHVHAQINRFLKTR